MTLTAEFIKCPSKGKAETRSPNWNAVLIKFINYTCVFPAKRCQILSWLKVYWDILQVVTVYILIYVYLCSQHHLVVATGRTSKRRLATCCFTPTASPGAQCRSRRTGRGWYAVVHTAVSPVPRERLVLTLTPIVHFMEPDGRYSTQRAWMSQLGAIAGATEYKWEKDWCQRKQQKHISN